MKRALVINLAILVVAFATGGSTQELDDFVLSGNAATRALTRTEINIDTAERIAKACIAYAEQRDIVVSVSILSPAGTVVYAYRMDGMVPINVETAQAKAETALYMRTSTTTAANRYGLEARVTRTKLDQYFVAGGLPIVVDGQLIGSIGVGGNRLGDEPCAHAALTDVLGPQPPLVEEQ